MRKTFQSQLIRNFKMGSVHLSVSTRTKPTPFLVCFLQRNKWQKEIVPTSLKYAATNDRFFFLASGLLTLVNPPTFAQHFPGLCLTLAKAIDEWIDMWSFTQPLSGSLWNDKKAYHLEKNVDWKKEKEKEKEEKWNGKGKR